MREMTGMDDVMTQACDECEYTVGLVHVVETETSLLLRVSRYTLDLELIGPTHGFYESTWVFFLIFRACLMLFSYQVKS